MKKLYTTPNRVFLYLLKASLEQSGIHCFIKNEDVAGQAAGELPPAVAMPEIWIMSDENFSDAQALLNTELQHYSSSKPSWNCANCQEKLEGQFDVCWKCGTEKSS